MSGNFKVGEVLVGQNFLVNTECNGQECVVIRGLAPSINRSWNTGDFLDISNVYEVQWSDGDICVVAPRNLRRKRPPVGEKFVMDMFKVSPPKRQKEPA